MKLEKQGGFTLIELVVVIVILGILAATALPRFTDLRNDAGTAGAQGVAGAVSSGFSVNAATCLARNFAAPCVRLSTATEACNTRAAAVLQGGVPAGYTVATTDIDCTGGAASSGSCVVTNTATAQTATATLLCTG